MMSTMWKSTFREIKQSFGRFMAIFAITALGVSLFSGLKVLQPAMIKTTDDYLREKAFYNYRILSSLGFEEEDLEFLQKQQDVRLAEGAVSFDMLCGLKNESPRAVKIYNLPENINGIELMAGRMPEAADECLVDSATNGANKIGKKIYLSADNDKEDLENFIYKEYTIVGTVQSSAYIQFERGNTSIGNGKIQEFMYIPMEAFDVEFYTEILIKFDEDYKIYSDEYKAYMDEKESVWEKLAEEAAVCRYDRLMAEAEIELADAKQELADGKSEGETELADARKELADAYQKLKDGEKEITDAKQEIADGRADLESGRHKLSDAEQEIADNRKKLESGEAEIAKNRALLETKKTELEDGKKQLDSANAVLSEKEVQLESTKALVESLKTGVDAYEALSMEQQAELSATLTMLKVSLQENSDPQPVAETAPTILTAYEAREMYAEISQIVEMMEVQLQEGKAELEAKEAELLLGEAQLTTAFEELEKAQKEINSGKQQLEAGIKQLRDGWSDISDGEKELLDGEAELADAEKDLAKGWSEYRDGYQEYEEGYQEFLTEIADAEEKIADAEKEIADIEEPESFVLGRETNVGYVCMENDSAIVDGIANVFPVFFYAVSALVCITTMSRMIEEQRTQIGVLKALGYSEASIMGKYLFYSGAAAISGCVFGYFFGIWFFPLVIWYAYSTMYTIGEIAYVFDAGILGFSLIVSAACSMGVTFISCKNELSQVAAELMRPKAPKAGKRIFLEYLPFVWKNMKFLHKVSYRNVFRYKKRFFMMVIGISGCTGLLVTGFGIQDSIANIANDQYDRIQVYDVNVMMSDEIDEDTDSLVERIAEDRVSDYLFVMEKSIDLVTEDAVKSISLISIDEKDDISEYVVLPDEETGEVLEYPGEGECILTNKIAKTYDLKVGDKVMLRDEDNHTMELQLSGIAENYLYNFVYMTNQTYEKCLGEQSEMKSIYLNLSEDADPHHMTADFMKDEEVASASVSSDAKSRFTNMIESLDLLVVVIIICAGALAFIVLYNLTNINITERIREIATIKVLGFYKNETSAYVFRENMILTAIGAVAGLGLGYLFHAFVMLQVQVDQVSFDVKILPQSYLYSVLLTFVFAVIVNLFMGKKLDRVSMTESLKSVD